MAFALCLRGKLSKKSATTSSPLSVAKSSISHIVRLLLPCFVIHKYIIYGMISILPVSFARPAPRPQNFVANLTQKTSCFPENKPGRMGSASAVRRKAHGLRQSSCVRPTGLCSFFALLRRFLALRPLSFRLSHSIPFSAKPIRPDAPSAVKGLSVWPTGRRVHIFPAVRGCASIGERTPTRQGKCSGGADRKDGRNARHRQYFRRQGVCRKGLA